VVNGSMPAAPAGASRDDGVIPRVPFGHPGLLAPAPPGHFLAFEAARRATKGRRCLIDPQWSDRCTHNQAGNDPEIVEHCILPRNLPPAHFDSMPKYGLSVISIPIIRPESRKTAFGLFSAIRIESEI
jgi:hypothetical protein